jgi:glutathione S-transferase
MPGDATEGSPPQNREIPLIDSSAAREDAPVANKLLAIPGSYPCAAVAAMLDAKGVAYSCVDLVPALSRLWLRATGFPRATVPALRLDGARVQGTAAIARALDARWPDPPLFPADHEVRKRRGGRRMSALTSFSIRPVD